MNNDDYAVLEITSWMNKKIGKVSFKGTHFYGRIIYNKEGKEYIHYLDQLLSVDFAKKLTDAEGYIYHPGNVTERFETKEDIRQMAIYTIKNTFPECNVLFEVIGNEKLSIWTKGE